LCDRPRAPHRSPRATPREIAHQLRVFIRRQIRKRDAELPVNRASAFACGSSRYGTLPLMSRSRVHSRCARTRNPVPAHRQSEAAAQAAERLETVRGPIRTRAPLPRPRRAVTSHGRATRRSTGRPRCRR
jgi:hypothetical protein